MHSSKQDIIQQLKNELLNMHRLKKAPGQLPVVGLNQIEKAFPDNAFPLGVMHEFITYKKEEAAATNGFMAALISQLAQKGMAVWISNKRTIFPPALTSFGITPEQILFIDLVKHKEVLWAIEEALKCNAVSAVIGELSELSFTESRRLQLAVEQSRVTGFIHRYNPKSENVTACVTRWKIKPLASSLNEELPGIGFPAWNIELLKVRNGKPGAWHIQWASGHFECITPDTELTQSKQLLRTA